MLFNSIDFAIFLPIVFLFYWFVINKSVKYQNLFIVLVSYVFYGWWDWRFLSLILFSTCVDYLIGRELEKSRKKSIEKLLLVASLAINLGLLGFFKYFNFFIDSFTSAFTLNGYSLDSFTLNIILPVGISFYTFQTLSYTIDVYRGKLKATNDFVAFASFVSFFPQLVAGPIERASHLLPQFYRKRKFEYKLAVNGMRQIIWGLFKKVVIADNCAEFANLIFNNSADYSGGTLVLGALFFTFQIYGDFSGYSDIAIGSARLLGFDLMQNFAFPYFSRDIAEFWRRWHISLSTWFRDYVYIPLGGSKGGKLMKIRNTFVIFVVSGFWHGANWTFIFWGFLNALYFIPVMLAGNNRNNIEVVSYDRFFPFFRDLVKIGLTFSLTIFAWIFFRADSLTHAFSYISSIFEGGLFELQKFNNFNHAMLTLGLILSFLTVEWLGRRDKFAIEKLPDKLKLVPKYIMYYTIVIIILWFSGKEQDFIYFQF
ncbi:MAG: alginate O-acetyltransferase complex protein AlgI [Sediminicola sp.]|jgi:alginate O-acetyltransferase complex protein AlgI